MKFSALVLLLFACTSVQAQKENNVWMGGINATLNFISGNPVVSSRPDNNTFWRTNASVCDSDGNLLLYTNGYRIFDKNHQVMPSGDQCNVGDYSQLGYGLLSVADGAAIVPKPNDPGKYYVFHTDLNWMAFDTFGSLFMPLHLYYSIVDMSLNGGAGDVVAGQKDILLLNDTITHNGFKVVKHANGRDYWLLTHEANTDRYYRYLIDPSGVHGPYYQSIGMPMQGEQCFGFSPLVFSRDGSKAVQLASKLMMVDVYDFDRCSGLLALTNAFSVSDTAYYLEDAEFSATGRYLYVGANYRTYVFQFDLSLPNIASSKQLVAVASGTPNPFAITFERMRLAPDNKIYIASYDGNQSLSVINHPDSAGTACGFVEQGLDLNPPGHDWRGMPNVINYSLGPLYGSGCDTLTVVDEPAHRTSTLNVYPNPANSIVTLDHRYKQGVSYTVAVTDLLGHVALSTSVPAASPILDVAGLADGAYLVELRENNHRVATSKLVILR